MKYIIVQLYIFDFLFYNKLQNTLMKIHNIYFYFIPFLYSLTIYTPNLVH